MSNLGKILLLLTVLLIGPVLALAGSTARLGQDWRTADRSSAGIAPLPADAPEAIASVWAAVLSRAAAIFRCWTSSRPTSSTIWRSPRL